MFRVLHEVGCAAIAERKLDISYRSEQAHPRLRGEHEAWLPLPKWEGGSSPPTRGTLETSFATRTEIGLIPAYAGNTGPIRARTFHSRAHPRLRGEHSAAAACCGHTPGSSPPTRGTPSTVGRRVGTAGLIPAYAGNTSRRQPPKHSHRAHPRLRGEHIGSNTSLGHNPGSSPPTRGTRQRIRTTLTLKGLIPAYAGNTGLVGKPSHRYTAHPRLRGEHRWQRRGGSTVQGSSPPTRGTPLLSTGAPAGRGLIPAYAGNTV